MNEIQTFTNENCGSVRAFLDEDGEPMFVARDLCDALGIDKYRDAVSRLDEDERGSVLVDTPGGKQNMSAVTEPGFYKLVMRSRKPEAKAFQRWVTHEVLPELRRYGAVVLADDEEDESLIMARGLLAADRKIKRQQARIDELTAEHTELMNENARLLAKSRAFDLWVDDADGLISVTKAGKLLRSLDPTMGSKKLHNLLREHGYIEKKSLSCTVKAIEPGYMRERLVKFVGKDGHERVKSYGCLTAKGVGMCASRFCGQGSIQGV